MLRVFLTAGWVAAVGASCTCAPEAPPPPLPSEDQNASIVARWDGGLVTAEEVRSAAARLPIGLREQFGTLNGQEQFLDAVISRKLLHDEARRQGLAEREDIKRQVVELEERLTIQALLVDAERKLGPPSEAELREYFQRHEAELRTPPRVRATRILLRGNPSTKALQARAEGIRARLLRGEPVEKLAALGEGPELHLKGDIGWIAEATDAETTAALGLLKVGAVAPPVETPSGLSILVATAREEARVPAFEAVRETLSGRISAGRQRKAFDELVKRLRDEAQVQLNPSAMR